jgi:hypothetical protein
MNQSLALERRDLIAQAVAAQGMVSPGVAAPVVPQVAVSLGVAVCNAESSEFRSFRNQLRWQIGQGVLTMIAGAALLLPPVGQFLRKRRTIGAEPPAPADRPRE